LPPAIYATATPLTLADDRLADFAHSRLKRRTAAGLLGSQAVRAAIDYAKARRTDHGPPRRWRWAAACQDHARVHRRLSALQIPALRLGLLLQFPAYRACVAMRGRCLGAGPRLDCDRHRPRVFVLVPVPTRSDATTTVRARCAACASAAATKRWRSH
jgi:hypothetical protein